MCIRDRIGVLYFVFHRTYDDQVDRRNKIFMTNPLILIFKKWNKILKAVTIVTDSVMKKTNRRINFIVI